MLDKFKSANEIRRQKGYSELSTRAIGYFFRTIAYRLHRDNYGSACEEGLVNRPHYGYCAYRAGRLAQALGKGQVSLIEFGVAGGDGLLNLETHVGRIEQELDVEFEIYGFDLGEGLPTPEDYRDVPYLYEEGFYEMDVDSLKSKLTRSNLLLGDVKETVPAFVSEHEPAPIGSIFLDLDFYSSTMDAFEIFEFHDEFLLPRVILYLDDVSMGREQYIPQIGELRAVRDFNSENEEEQIGKIQHRPESRLNRHIRPASLYSYHRFSHEEYTTFVGQGEH